MGDTTNISYVDHSWSPWLGCEPVSPGCAHCYASAISKRAGRGAYRHGMPRTLTKDWSKPVRWNNQAMGRERVLVSMCDPFDDDAPVEWHLKFLDLISDTPNLTWLLLTKRPEEISRIGQWPDNVWMGVSVENQETAERRIPSLLGVPAKVLWISYEPALGPINFKKTDIVINSITGKISWLVMGGESGFNHRKMEIEWMRTAAGQAEVDGVAFYCKQDSHRFPGQQGRIPDDLWALKQFPKP